MIILNNIITTRGLKDDDYLLYSYILTKWVERGTSEGIDMKIPSIAEIVAATNIRKVSQSIARLTEAGLIQWVSKPSRVITLHCYDSVEKELCMLTNQELVGGLLGQRRYGGLLSISDKLAAATCLKSADKVMAYRLRGSFYIPTDYKDLVDGYLYYNLVTSKYDVTIEEVEKSVSRLKGAAFIKFDWEAVDGYTAITNFEFIDDNQARFYEEKVELVKVS